MFTFFLIGSLVEFLHCGYNTCVLKKSIFLMAHALKKQIQTVKNMQPSGFNG